MLGPGVQCGLTHLWTDCAGAHVGRDPRVQIPSNPYGFTPQGQAGKMFTIGICDFLWENVIEIEHGTGYLI